MFMINNAKDVLSSTKKSISIIKSIKWVNAIVLLVLLVTQLPISSTAGTAPYTKLAAGSPLRNIKIAGVNTVPANAVQVIANITATGTGGPGYLSIAPVYNGSTASILNYNAANETVANMAVLDLDASGEVDAFSTANTDLLIDVVAYMTSRNDVTAFDPARVYDSRGSTGGHVAPFQKRVIDISGHTGAGAKLAIINVTVTNPESPGWTSVVPCSQTAHSTTSNVNVDITHPTRAAMAFAKIEAGKVCVVSQNKSDIIVDIQGYITNGVSYLNEGPMRVEDSRNSADKFLANTPKAVQISGKTSAPASASAVFGGITETGAAGPGFAAVSASSTFGNFSNLNFPGSDPVGNGFISRQIDGKLYGLSSVKTDLIFDIFGYIDSANIILLSEPTRVIDTRSFQLPSSCVAGAPIAQVNTSKKVMTFTFDDGPDPVFTRKIMDTFEAKGLKGKATFFQTGEMMKNYPAISKEVAARGYTIGNHSMTHQYSPAIIASEIAPMQQLIKSTTGVTARYFRSPGLTLGAAIDEAAAQNGVCNILTGDDIGDSKGPIRKTSAELMANFRATLTPGDILMLHDGGGFHQATVDSVGPMIDFARAQGYEILSMDEILTVGSPRLYKNSTQLKMQPVRL